MSPQVSNSSRTGGTEIELEVDYDEASATISGSSVDISSPVMNINVQLRVFDPFSQNLSSGTIEFDSSGLLKLERDINNSIDKAAKELPIDTEFIPEKLRSADLDNKKFRNELRSITVPCEELEDIFTPGGQNSFSAGKSIRPPVVAVPDTPVMDELISNRSVSLNAIFDFSTALPFGFKFSANPETSVDIPAEAFVARVDVSDIKLDCGTAFSEIDTQISRLQNDLSRSVDRLQSLAGEVESLATEIGRKSGATISVPSINCPDADTTRQREQPPPIGGQAVLGGGALPTVDQSELIPDGGGNPLMRISQSELEDIGRNELRGLKTRIEDVLDRADDPFPEGISLAELENRTDSLSDRISGIEVPNCREAFSTEFSDIIKPLLERVRCLNNTIRDFTLGLGNLRNKIEIPSCTQEFSSINREIESVENRLKSVDTLSQKQAESLRGKTNDIIDRINKRGEIEESGCLQQFEERIDRIDRRIRRQVRADVEVRRVKVEKPTPTVTCESEFSGIDKDLTRLEQRILALNAPVSNRKINSILNDAEGILEDVQGIDDPQCLEEFRKRINRAINRVTSLRGQTRVTIKEEETQADEAQEELLKRVTKTLEKLSEQTPDSDVGERFSVQ